MAERTTKPAVKQPKTPSKTAERSMTMQPEGQSVADIVQHKLQLAADASAEGDRNQSMQAMADQSRTVMQARRMGEAVNEGNSRQEVTQSPTQLQAQGSGQVKPLPQDVRAGTESLSGMSLGDVRVHHNSPEPAQLQAHAFAKGNEIHLGPGQENHLPHEAWHVVQQRQGRVTPTTQLQHQYINDDTALEKEADIMGARALQAGGISGESPLQRSSENDHGKKGDITQRFKWPWQNSNYQKLDDENEAELSEREDDAAPLLGRGQRSDDYEEELADDEDSGGSFTAEAGGITYEDGVVTIPFLDDYELKIGKKGASASGSLPSSTFEMDLPSVDFGIDVPFAPGVYATAKLAITPTFKLTVAGGEYAVSVGDSNTLSLSDAGVTGEVGLEITAKGGVGAGIANVAGLEGGVFGTLGTSATIAGSLGGSMDFADKAGSIDLGINAGADIYGMAGMFVTAKFLILNLTKTFPLGEKKFAHFSYNRNISLGVDNESWKPTIEDLTKMEFGDKASGRRLKSFGGKMYEELTDED